MTVKVKPISEHGYVNFELWVIYRPSLKRSWRYLDSHVGYVSSQSATSCSFTVCGDTCGLVVGGSSVKNEIEGLQTVKCPADQAMNTSSMVWMIGVHPPLRVMSGNRLSTSRSKQLLTRQKICAWRLMNSGSDSAHPALATPGQLQREEMPSKEEESSNQSHVTESNGCKLQFGQEANL